MYTFDAYRFNFKIKIVFIIIVKSLRKKIYLNSKILILSMETVNNVTRCVIRYYAW